MRPFVEFDDYFEEVAMGQLPETSEQACQSEALNLEHLVREPAAFHHRAWGFCGQQA